MTINSVFFTFIQLISLYSSLLTLVSHQKFKTGLNLLFVKCIVHKTWITQWRVRIFHFDWWFVCFHVSCHKLFLEFEICYSFCWKTLSTFDSSKMMHFDVNSSGYNLTFCSVHPQTISEWGKSICRSFIKHYIHQSNLNWHELSIF